MNDDLLSRATRALREETRDDDAGARFTRSRIMASVHEERVRSRTRLAFLIPIAATFMAASAWGAASGKLGKAVEAVTEAIGLSTPPPAPLERPRTPSGVRPAPPPAPVAVEAPPAAAVEPSAAPPPAPPPEPVATNAAARGAPSSAPATAADAGAAEASDPVFELYRVAHQAHFVEQDSERALRAWNAYLKAAPSAPLALEARYNRAICLVRLHRTSEARAALLPFAEGFFNGYRKAEAAELIAALPPELEGPGDGGP